MTKIKNTKKGMAKKTLSMSLVVAMLATSNVPVWAAEFSDGSDVAVTSEFSDDATVTSTVVNNTVDASAAQVADGYTLTSNVELKTTTGDWSGALTLAAKAGVTAGNESFVITDKDGVEVNPSRIEVYYNNDIQGTGNAVASLADINSVLSSYTPELSTYKNGKNVSVKVYVANVNDAVATLDYTLNAVDISGKDIAYAAGAVGADKEANYDGNAHYPTNVEVLNMGGSKAPVAGTDVTISYQKSTDGIDVGTYNFYAEGIEDAGYTGRTKLSADVFTINTVAPTADNISVAVSGDVAYTGSAVKPSSVVVTDKKTGKVISSDLYTVSTSNSAVGTYDSTVATTADDKYPLDITITMKADNDKTGDEQVTNNFTKDTTIPANAITGSYKITALDLSTLPSKYDITAPAKTVAADNTYSFNWSDLTFVDKSTGTTVAASDIIANASDLTVVATAEKGAASGTVTVSASATATGKVTNSFNVNFRIADAAKTETDVRIPAGTKIGDYTVVEGDTVATLRTRIEGELAKSVYTGEALEPLKSVLSTLVWKDKGPDNKDMALVYGTDYTITYANNVESDAVKTDKGTVTINFIGKYSGEIKFDLPIKQADVTVSSEDLTYEAGKTSYDAKVKVVTKDANNNDVAVPESNYTVTYLTKATSVKAGENTATATVTFTNKNYKVADADTNTDNLVKTVTSTLKGKNLSDDSITAQVTGSYTYTGKTITPTLEVKDGTVTLIEGTDYKVTNRSGIEAGEATVTIEAIADGNYAGTRTVKYTIEKADLKDTKVVSSKDDANASNYDQVYTGQVQGPDINEISIGGAKLEEYDEITKKGDYIITYDENAKEVGTYNYTITAVASSTKIQGTITGTYQITAKKINGQFVLKNTPNYVDGSATDLTPDAAYYMNYTGKAFTLDDLKQRYVVVDSDSKVLTEGKDYRLEYENNIDAGIATVYAYGLGNYAYTENGREISIASANFVIKGVGNITADDIKSISDVEYAGGLYVEPNVVVKVDGKTLVQGTDYVVKTYETEVGEYDYSDVTIYGKGSYTAGTINNVGALSSVSKTWKVAKKDLANTAINVDEDNNVTVVNGTVIIPTSEYDVNFSEDGTTVTVTAKADSKYYTGSKEITVESAKVGQAMISSIVINGNTVTPVLSGEVDEAVGYDYVIATEEDYKNGRVDISKNILKTSTNFYYVQEGTYYAYCHAWKRNNEGLKVFGEWSNIVKFTVTATTPSAPTVTSVKVNGSTVTVTYTASEDATGYDVVLGSAVKAVNGEKRPVDYGKLVKKNIKGNVVTATFKNVPAGKYYAGVHSFNRTSETGSKVFSEWSNNKAVTVK